MINTGVLFRHWLPSKVIFNLIHGKEYVITYFGVFYQRFSANLNFTCAHRDLHSVSRSNHLESTPLHILGNKYPINILLHLSCPLEPGDNHEFLLHFSFFRNGTYNK